MSIKTNLNVKLSKKLGGQPKIWEGHGPPSPPFRSVTVALSLFCDVRYSTMEKLS